MPQPAHRTLLAALCLLLLPLHAARAQPAGPPPTEAEALGDIRQRVEARDTEGALSRLDALQAAKPGLAARPALRYLRARLYEQRDQLDAALASLPAEDGLPDLVAQDVHKRRAIWLGRTGHCQEAQPLLAEFARDAASDAKLSMLSADCALARGDTGKALSLLRDNRSASGADRFEIRRAAAGIGLQTGDKTSAQRELHALYVEFPSHSQNAEVLAQLRALDRNFKPSNQDYFERAERWLAAARPDPAWAELQHVTFPKTRNAREQRALQPERTRLLHLKGMTLFKMRTRYGEAAKVLKQAASSESPTQADDAYHSAQAIARADRNKDAVRAFYAFAQRFPKHHYAPAALQRAAWLELRHNLPGGEKHMRAILERAERSGARAKHTQAEVLWELALHGFAHKHCDRALPLFERYAGTGKDALVKARGLYWAGRCAAQLGDRDRAVGYYKGAMAVEPLHWYALLARQRIAAAGRDPGLPFAQPRSDAAMATEPAPVPVAVALPPAAAFYAELGLLDDAVRALKAREKQLRSEPRDNGLVRLIGAYHALNEHARPFALAARERNEVLYAAPTPAARPFWDALLPKPYPEDMASAAQAIAPELVYAVMRKESAFNPRALSYADAIGLLQLIEPTAKKCAEELAIPHFERDQLYDPPTNIKLGAHYLTKLVARYHGQAVPAIAAYNAGEHRVDPWLDRLMRADKTVELDQFVEEIPFDQTRDYVRGVVTSWARYVYLYERRDNQWPLELALSFKR